MRRSTPSILLVTSIQRLHFRQLHTPLPSPIISSGFDSNQNENPALVSFLKWVSGISAGSGLGFLYWSSSSTDSSSALSFADCSAATSGATVQNSPKLPSRSFFHKLSLPENSPKFLFGGNSLILFIYFQI